MIFIEITDSSSSGNTTKRTINVDYIIGFWTVASYKKDGSVFTYIDVPSLTSGAVYATESYEQVKEMIENACSGNTNHTA